MKWLLGVTLVLAVVSLGAAAAPQTAGPSDAHQMPAAQQSMMARMSAADDQLAMLRTELNDATTADAKLAATTKILNVLLDERAMMRTQMDDMHKRMMEQPRPTTPSDAPHTHH
jgi:hypothetical protein